MKVIYKKICLTIVFIICAFLPTTSFAEDHLNSVLPPNNLIVTYDQLITTSGNYDLPAGWLGAIRIFIDNKEVTGSGFPILINNTTGSGVLSSSFTRDIGVLTSGVHTFRPEMTIGLPCTMAKPPSCDLKTGENNSYEVYPTQTITVSEPPYPVMEIIGPSPLNFFDRNIGTSVTLPVTIKNSGSGVTNIIGFGEIVSGTNYLCEGGCDAFSIPGGGTKTVNMRFNVPNTVMSGIQGTVRFTCSTCKDGQKIMNLLLTGNAIGAPTPPQIQILTGPVDFGTQIIGIDTNTETITIKNIGGTATNINVSTSLPTTYMCTRNCTFLLQAGETNDFDIKYKPTLAGPQPSTLTVSGDPGVAQATLGLTGKGWDKPILDVWAESVAQDWTLEPFVPNPPWSMTHLPTGQYTIDYGNIQVGELFDGRRMEIVNVGGGLLNASVTNLPSGDGVFVCGDDTGPKPSECGVYPPMRNYRNGNDLKDINVWIQSSTIGPISHDVIFNDLNHGTKITVTIKANITVSPEPVVGDCNMYFGNVLMGDSTLPKGDNRVKKDCYASNEGGAPYNLYLYNFDRTPNGYPPTTKGRFTCFPAPTGAGPAGDQPFQCPAVSGGPILVNPGQTVYFQYQYTALSGAQEFYFWASDKDNNGNWRMKTDVPGKEYLDVYMRGGGVLLTSQLTPLSVPNYDFGKINVNTVSPPKLFKIEVVRTGGCPLNSYACGSSWPGVMQYDLDMSGAPANFQCAKNCSKLLNPNGAASSEIIELTYNPGLQTTPILGTVKVQPDFKTWTYSNPVAPHTLNLVGSGNDQPIPKITGDITGAIVDFGSVVVGTSPPDKIINIENIGVGVLTGTLSDATLALPFSCVSGCTPPDLSIIPSGSHQVTFRFRPTSDGFYSKTIVLHPTNPGLPDTIITVQGVGKAQPLLEVIPPTPIDFDNMVSPTGYTNIGLRKRYDVTIRNAGFGNMSVNLTFVSPTLDYTILGPTGFILGTNESQIVTLDFSPSVSGSRTATLQVNATGPLSYADTKTIALTGTAEYHALLVISGATTQFGSQYVDTITPRVLQFENSGTGDLGTGVLNFPPDSAFSCTASSEGMDVDPLSGSVCKYNLANGKKNIFTIVFHPTALIDYSSPMTFSNFASSFSYNFTGRGIPRSFKIIEK